MEYKRNHAMKIDKVGIIDNGEVGKALVQGLTIKKNLFISAYDIFFKDYDAKSIAVEEKNRA